MSKRKVQGEGDYEAAREYRKHTEDFVDSGKVDKAARKAAPADKKTRQEMKQAEEEGKRHAQERDPNVHRDYHKGS